MKLIIVESPTKAKTFTKILDKRKYKICATMGHIRDLPSKRMGIEIDNKFLPQYDIVSEKRETIKSLKKISEKADAIILATDSDREGEAIAYHVAYVLGYAYENWPDIGVDESKVSRIVFHEITTEAIKNALNNPSTLNIDLIEAQQGRRLLDRIVGYKLSPLLWRKMGKRWLSAGRVQTVALRFLVDRESEIASFKSTPYYKVVAQFSHADKVYDASLIKINDKSIITKKSISLFDGTYTYSYTTINKVNKKTIEENIKKATYQIGETERKEFKKNPPPPFTTSTLQQTSFRMFGYSSKMTMSLAQKLYEEGHITYHRTDSMTMSDQFVKKAESYVGKTYGKQYVVDKRRYFKTKSKLAQEAHEAIRPTELKNTISQSKRITNRHIKLYKLIYKRSIALSMKDAIAQTVRLLINSNKNYTFESKTEYIIFNGYLLLYEIENKRDTKELPQKGLPINLTSHTLIETETTPPPRYSEASLIKTLEERGIGRPSTYAPTMARLFERNYIEKLEKRLHPTALGIAVSNYLSTSFPKLFAIEFTAKMEDALDDIAGGNMDLVPLLEEFYYPFVENVKKESSSQGYIDVEEKTDKICPKCEGAMVVRFSKYGKFFACKNYPKCKHTESYVNTIDKKCPECGANIVVKFTKRKRRFYGCSRYPDCTYASWKLNQIP